MFLVLCRHGEDPERLQGLVAPGDLGDVFSLQEGGCFQRPGFLEQLFRQFLCFVLVEPFRFKMADAALGGKVGQAQALSCFIQQGAQRFLKEIVDIQKAGEMLAFLVETDLAVQQAVLCNQTTLLEADFDGMTQLFRIAWLEEIISSPAFQRLNCGFYCGISSGEDDVRGWIERACAADQFQAANFGHDHVGQDDIDFCP